MWTVNELQSRLRESRRLKRRRDRRLLLLASPLVVWFGVAALLVAVGNRTWEMILNAWFAAIAAFLLYVVFTARHARSERATRCPHCQQPIDAAWEDNWDEYVLRTNPPTVDCPACGQRIAAQSA